MFRALAERALTELHAATEDYRYDITGLEADPEIVAYVERWFEQSKPAPEVTDEDYFALIRLGKGTYTAALSLGLDPMVVLRRLRTDPEFVDRVKISKAISLEGALEAAREKAEGGDMRAFTKLVESLNPEEFGAQPKVAIQINNGTHAIAAASGKGALDPIDREILLLKGDLEAKRDARLGLPPGDIIDIPFGETSE